jgi:peptidoglycan/xylan/chitin deacetylase (PgdA/CDA1 family)
MRAQFVALGGFALGLGLVGCPEDRQAIDHASCVGRQAVSFPPVFGASMGAKQLALSFDDGPASRTSDLSAYLKGQGIRATFFVNANAQQAAYLSVLPQLVADGHVLGNHTKNHLDLTTLDPAQIVDEVTQLDAVIAPYVPNARFLFRAPFGAYDQGVYDALAASPMNKYVGHVEWESGDNHAPPNEAADVQCWQADAMTSKECGDLYVKEIETVGKGIVLMHDADYGDSTNTNVSVGKGNTVDMVKYIVPILKSKGFTFIGVDEVPAIASMLPPLPPDAGPDGSPDGGSGTSSSSTSSSGGSSGASSGGSSSGTPVDAGDPCASP